MIRPTFSVAEIVSHSLCRKCGCRSIILGLLADSIGIPVAFVLCAGQPSESDDFLSHVNFLRSRFFPKSRNQCGVGNLALEAIF